MSKHEKMNTAMFILLVGVVGLKDTDVLFGMMAGAGLFALITIFLFVKDDVEAHKEVIKE